MKNLPLDVGRLGVALCVSVEVKTDLEGVVKTDKDGVEVWTVGVAVRPEGRKTALIEVAVSGEPSGIAVGQPVLLSGLEAFWWEMNGRAGLSFRAESVSAAGVVPATPTAVPAVPASATAPVAGEGESRAARGGGAK